MYKRLLTSAIVLLLVTACGGLKNDAVVGNTANLSIALQEAIDRSVLPAISDFQGDAVSLSSAVTDFCSSIDAPKLEALQDKWKVLFAQWYRLANYNFGPLNADPVFPIYTFIDSLRLRGTNYLSTVREEISDNIQSDDTLDDAYYSGKTFQRVGLLAVEVAIFETADSSRSNLTSDILNEYQTQPRKCLVLQGLVRQIVVQATTIQSQWNSSDNSYRDVFLSGELDDGSEPLSTLLAATQQHLDYLGSRDVVNIAGSLSLHNWQAIDAAIKEVEQLLEGTINTSVSFFGLIESAGKQTIADNVRNTINELHLSIDTRNVSQLNVLLRQLDGYFKRDIPDSLEVDLGINFSDGD